MGCITIKHMLFDFEEIKKGNWKNLDSRFTEAFEFCRAWLSGEENFEIQTSGSTGKPKTISIKRKQMVASAKATKSFFKLKKDCAMLCCLDTGKIAGKMMLVRAMEWEARLMLIAPTSKPLLDLSGLHFDFVAMVPLQVQASIKDPVSRKLFDQIRILIIGGAPITDSLKNEINSLNLMAFQTYGMTETVSHIALADLKDNGPMVYYTLPGVNIGADDQGRLLIKAPMTEGNWIETQDIVKIKDKNNFIWKGRADFVINSGGLKFYPEEIESKISQILKQFLPGSAYYIAGKPDEILGQAMVLVVEGEKDPDVEEQIIKAAKRQLSKYHAPKSMVFVKCFEWTDSGKINRKATLEKCMEY